jgi:hypothetical protein
LSGDVNSRDTFGNSTTSSRSSDIVHDESDMPAEYSEFNSESKLGPDSESIELEAAGTAAESESGSATSSDQENSSTTESESSIGFDSNDPLLHSDLSTPETDLNYPYRDNRAHGVGSLATGEFGAAAVGQPDSASSMSDEELANSIKARLTRESSGTHGLMRHEVSRNVQVSTDNGNVTLTGSVPSEADKDMIEIRVAEISGVKSVKNNLSVNPESDPANRNLSRGHDLEDATSSLQN